MPSAHRSRRALFQIRRGRWSVSRSPHPGWSTLTLAVVLLTGACGNQATPGPTQAPSASASGPVSPSAPPSAAASPSPSPSVAASPLADPARAPFTILVLGLDDGLRSDAIMVVGVDPTGPRLSFASLPRDTINVPLPDGGALTNRKINTFYQSAAKDPKRYPAGPGRATADVIESLLDIRIDYFAATTFQGFERLAGALGGIPIDLARSITDPKYQITARKIGVRFAAGPQTLDGQRSLIFVRTRGGDNDFERQRRQQQFLIAAGRRLTADPSRLQALSAVAKSLYTDFPLAKVPALLQAMRDVPDSSIQRVVLGPRKYESGATCPCGYALAPKLDAMRTKAAALFPWAVQP